MECPHCGEEIDEDLREDRGRALRDFDRRLRMKQRQFTGLCLDEDDDDDGD